MTPALALLAGTVLVLRLLPLVARAAERAAAGGRGLTAALAGRQLSRRPMRGAGPVLLLVLAVALGTMAIGRAPPGPARRTTRPTSARGLRYGCSRARTAPPAAPTGTRPSPAWRRWPRRPAPRCRCPATGPPPYWRWTPRGRRTPS
ncbi:hypothetical protein ID867_13065 [Streptomyces parvulus]|nr:hypothetical protein [Streptomyces parvulus]